MMVVDESLVDLVCSGQILFFKIVTTWRNCWCSPGKGNGTSHFAWDWKLNDFNSNKKICVFKCCINKEGVSDYHKLTFSAPYTNYLPASAIFFFKYPAISTASPTNPQSCYPKPVDLNSCSLSLPNVLICIPRSTSPGEHNTHDGTYEPWSKIALAGSISQMPILSARWSCNATSGQGLVCWCVHASRGGCLWCQ